jgi:UPF0271 protein
MNPLDLNSDLGEWDTPEGRALDADMMPLLSSVNIACGGHAGSPELMRRTAQLAAEHGVAIGAHPGFEDRIDFGRTERRLPPEKITRLVADQVSTLRDMLRNDGLPLRHVKPHGGLYNMAAADPAVAQAVIMAVQDLDASLSLYVLSGSVLMRMAQAAGLHVVREAFADRAYHADGRLVARSEPGALLSDPAAVRQRLRELLKGTVTSIEGRPVPIEADSVCLHADTSDGIALARLVRRELTSAGVRITAPRHAL